MPAPTDPDPRWYRTYALTVIVLAVLVLLAMFAVLLAVPAVMHHFAGMP